MGPVSKSLPGIESSRLVGTYDSFRDFVSRSVPWLSRSKLFVEKAQELAAGTWVPVELRLSHGPVLIRALGQVEAAEPKLADEDAGVVLRAVYLHPSSARLIASILRRHGAGPFVVAKDFPPSEGAIVRAPSNKSTGKRIPLAPFRILQPDPAELPKADLDLPPKAEDRDPEKTGSDDTGSDDPTLFEDAQESRRGSPPQKRSLAIPILVAVAITAFTLFFLGRGLLPHEDERAVATREASAVPEPAAATATASTATDGQTPAEPEDPLSPAAPVPASAPSAAAVPPAPHRVPLSPAELEREAIAHVERWARAWAAQDVETYLASYAADFRPASGLSHEDWIRQRRQRLSSPAWIKVQISNLETERLDDETVTVTFVQVFKSSTLTSRRATKSLKLERKANGFEIVQEKVER